jgi:hypothetical protein
LLFFLVSYLLFLPLVFAGQKAASYMNNLIKMIIR